MWQSEVKDSKIIDEYKEVIKKARKKSDNNFYLIVQLSFSLVILTTSFMLKEGHKDVFNYVKEDYKAFFETDNYIESTFSYNSFLENMYDELYSRFSQFVTVYNSKGSADIIPANASLKKPENIKKGMLPVNGYISSQYGIRNNPFDKKEKEFHTGMDIAAAKGSFVKASFTGTVTESAYSPVAGNYIKIQSCDEISTMYAHNQFNLVKTGDKVVAGQVIATIGATGKATGPHLHFEFLFEGVRYNPAFVISV